MVAVAVVVKSPYRVLAEDFARVGVQATPSGAVCLDVGSGWLRGRQRREDQWWVGTDRRPCGDTQCDMGALAFHDAVFDLVKATDVLYFAARPWEVLDEFARVLRGGGLFLATVPYLAGHIERGDQGRWSGESWMAMMREAGLTACIVTPLGGFVVTWLNILSGGYDVPIPAWMTYAARFVDRVVTPRADWWACGWGLAGRKA